MRQLYALGPGRGARGVVDRARGRLVPLPGRRVGSARRRGEELGVLVTVEKYPRLGRHPRQGTLQLGVDEEHRGTRVLDDVRHLVGVEPEIDRDERSEESTSELES